MSWSWDAGRPGWPPPRSSRAAGTGWSVVDQFEFGHTRGSSHGTERIVRVAYADAVHAEMAARSIDGWLQART